MKRIGYVDFVDKIVEIVKFIVLENKLVVGLSVFGEGGSVENVLGN